MSARQLLEEARRLSVAERMELVGEIWDSFDESSQPPITQAQRDELRRRIAFYDLHRDERGKSLAQNKGGPRARS